MRLLLTLLLPLLPQAEAPRWTAPVSPVVVRRGFDPPDQPWLAGHRGVDLAAPVGTPVRTAGSGVVRFAGVLAGRGVVSVAHANGLRTTYEPLEVGVAKGDAVRRGAVLGTLAPGHPGLHWGLRRDDVYLDPLLLLGSPEPARLLPLWHGADRVQPAAEAARRTETRAPAPSRAAKPASGAGLAFAGAAGSGLAVLAGGRLLTPGRRERRRAAGQGVRSRGP